MKSRFGLLLAAPALIFFSAAAPQPLQAKSDAEQICVSVGRLLEEGHYTHQPLNDDEIVVDNIAATINGGSLFFNNTSHDLAVDTVTSGLLGVTSFGISTSNGQVALRVPLDVVKAKSALYLHRGKPAKQKALTNGSDHTIVATYGAIYRGIVQYYLLAGDVYRLHRLRWVMETSMLKTLAGKHRSTVSKMAAKHKAKIQTPHGPRTCFEARIERVGRQPLVARFGETPLHRQKTATVTDRQPIRVDYPHKELLTRLLAGTCEICQQTGKVDVHHIRKLKDLAAPGPLQPQWAKAMAKRRRKTLVVCASCHDLIHARQPAPVLTQ